MRLKEKYIQTYIEWRTTSISSDWSKPDKLVDLGHELLLHGYMPIDIKRLNQEAKKLITQQGLVDRVGLFYQITEQINAGVKREANRRWAELERDAYDRKLLRWQRQYYNTNPCPDRRGFIFWYSAEGTSTEDSKRAASLERMCKLGWFRKVNSDYGIYHITDAGLLA